MHRLIDKGHQVFYDKDYAKLLNCFENVFDKFIEMASKIHLPVAPDLVKKYRDLRDKYDAYDSYAVVAHLEHYKINSSRNNNDIKIIFENDNSTSKACCNEKCVIF